MSSPVVTVCYTSHRIETLPVAGNLMAKHDVIILEEAPNENFLIMLTKKISIPEYIRREGLEFPAFSLRYYRLMRTFFSQGKKIVQIEPYIERLMQIYKYFSEGKGPSDIVKMPILNSVYQAEKNAARALFHYYESSLKASFPNLIDSLRNFAKHDAARFRMRDIMRARAIAKIIDDGKKYYIETGGMHIFLVRVLQKMSREKFSLEIPNVMTNELKKSAGPSDFLAPGDILTGHYILNKKENIPYERLLAARSIIYIKLLNKEELVPSRKDKSPHARDASIVNGLVSRLNLLQCGELYTKIRFHNRETAIRAVRDYLS